MQAQDAIYAAMRRIGGVRPGYLNGPELLADGLSELGYMFDSFNSQRTMQYTVPDYIYPVTQQGSAAIESGQVLGLGFFVGPSSAIAGTTTNTSKVVVCPDTSNCQLGMKVSGAGIPAGAYIASVSTNVSFTLSVAATASGAIILTTLPDFLGPRPTAIVRANLIYSSGSPTPARLPLSPLSAEEWANISVLELTPINVTTVFYYEPTFPCGIFWAWPPLNGNSLEFYTWGFLTAPAALTTVLSFPPGYKDAIIWTLASRLYGMIPKEVFITRNTAAYVNGMAYQARQDVKALNAPMPRLRCDFGGSMGGAPVSDWMTILAGIPY